MVEDWPSLAEALLALARDGLNFSEWEEDFLESCADRASYWTPSERQRDILERMAYSCELDTPDESWEALRDRLARPGRKK